MSELIIGAYRNPEAAHGASPIVSAVGSVSSVTLILLMHDFASADRKLISRMFDVTQAARSDAFIDQLGEEGGIDQKLTPLCVIGSCRFRGDGFSQRESLLLEPGDVLTDRDQHIAVILELGSVADRLTMSRDDHSVDRKSGV